MTMQTNEPDREMRFMVCLYGIALARAEIMPLLAEVDALLCAIDQAPSHVSVEAPGFGRKPLLFGNGWKRLQKAAPADITSVELYRLAEDWNTLSDWIAISSMLTRYSYFDLGTSLITVPDAEQRIMDLVQRWLHRIRPAYGIGFHRTRARGPDCYGIGLSFGYRGVYDGPEYEESKAVNRWSGGMREAVYDRGVLRDVYPYSLLTPRHLEREVVDGQALGDWIRAAPERGRLDACRDGYTLWTVAAEHQAAVRRQLAGHGALYVLDRDNHL